MTPRTDRILFVIATLGGGGAERVVSVLANHFAETGAEVGLLVIDHSSAKPAYPLSQSVRLMHLGYSAKQRVFPAPLRLLRRCLSIRRCLMQFQPVRVVSFMTSTNITVLCASLGLNLDVVVSERTDPALDWDLTWPWRVLRRLAYPAAKAVVVQNQKIREWFTSHGISNCVVISNPVEGVFRTRRVEEFMVLAIGRLTRVKGFDLLIRAFAACHREEPHWRLTILGQGPEREALIRLAAAEGVSQHLHMPGFVSDVSHWLSRAAMLVQPSRYEGMPNAVLEAMSAAVPVIASSDGAAAVISHAHNGLVVGVDDLDGLSASMLELMRSPERRKELGCNAQIAMRKTHDVAQVIHQWRVALGIS